MAKRPNTKSIRSARTYTVDEAADALGVSIGTVRQWAKCGLPILKSERPYLILGESLRDFLQSRSANTKSPLEQNQLYCLACKLPRIPDGLLVDLTVQTAKTARLTGLCSTCGGICNRMISRSSIEQFARIFDIGFRDGGKA